MSAEHENPADRRKARTARLQELLDGASRLRGLRGLTDAELLEFGRLYRQAAAELSHARSHGFDAAEMEQLNWLVGRAYGLLYVTESHGLRSIWRFFRTELPRTLRRHGRLIALSAGLFLASAAVGVVLTAARPDTLALISPGMADVVEGLARRHEGGRNWLPEDFRPIASSLIMVNNIQVSFLAFSTGIVLGLGTIVVLVYNGFVLGAIAAGVTPTPAGTEFWAFVAPHGSIELPAIIISGAAGLLLGRALIDPGEHSRLDALRLAGREAAVIMLGVVCFLVVAGVFEGLFSPSAAPPALKFAVAAALGTCFWSYILLPGRRAEVPAPRWAADLTAEPSP